MNLLKRESHLRDTAPSYRLPNAKNHDYAPYHESVMTAVDSWRSVPFLYLFSTSHPLSVPILYLLCTLPVPFQYLAFGISTFPVPFVYLVSTSLVFGISTFPVPLAYPFSTSHPASVPFLYPLCTPPVAALPGALIVTLF